MSRRSKKKTNQGKVAAIPGDTAGLNGRWTVLGVCLFLAAIVWVVFGQTLHDDFINFDDDDYVYENPEVFQGLTLHGIIWAFARFHADNWHPLTWVSHMLDCQFYGLNPGGHHLTNILLHTAVAILLFLVLRQMTGALWRSAFVAAVFAIHPLRVESVAWVAERKDVLSGVFFMLAIGAYVRYARHPWSPVRYGLVLLLFALGLLCKPMLVTLPFVLLLLDYWPLNRLAGSVVPKRLILEKLPLLGLAVASGVVTLFAQTGAIRSFNEISLPLRVGNAFISYATYLGQMFWPSGLAVLYPFPANGGASWEMILAPALLISISAGVFVLRKSRPYLLAGWLWYLVMLAPVIGILQVGAQARADRYTYLPQIGLYLMLTWAVADLCVRWRYSRLILVGLSTVILAALIYRARVQTSYWRNSESLWTHTLASTSDNFIAHNNLGNALLQKGKVDDAIAQFQQALQINPHNAEAAHNNFGNALLQKGHVDEAITQFQQALQINPDDANAHNNLGGALLQKGKVDEAITQFQQALQINPDDADAYINLGNALLQKGNADDAIAHYKKALQINPDIAEAHFNLGNALLLKGKVDEAIAHYQQALQIKPDYANALNNLGLALFKKGNVDEAIAQFQQALQIKPGIAEAHFNLGLALFKKGNVDEAIAHYQLALQIKPNYLEVHVNLGNALRQKGNMDEAIAHYQKALELAQAAGREDIVERLNAELKQLQGTTPIPLGK